MQIVSSYGVELRKQNIPIRQTLEIYRSAVSYLTEIYEQVWEELEQISDSKRRFNAAEHLVHTTKKNFARFDFDLRFPKMPSYLRRAAIQHALGSVSRDSKNHSLCVFQTGKRYNCDLSASYNIGARYFIRELLKLLPATERSLLEAKVPVVKRRTSCVYANLKELHLRMEILKVA